MGHLPATSGRNHPVQTNNEPEGGSASPAKVPESEKSTADAIPKYTSQSIDMESFKPMTLQDKNFYETYFYDPDTGNFGGEVGANNLLPEMGNLMPKLANTWNSIGTPGVVAAYNAFDLEAATLAVDHLGSLVDVFGGIESNVDQVMSYIQGFTNGGKGFDYDHAEIKKLMPVIDAYLAKADPASSDYESVQKLKELLTSGNEEISTEDAKNMQIYLTTFKQIIVPHEVSTKSLANMVSDANRTYQDTLASLLREIESVGSKYLVI